MKKILLVSHCLLNTASKLKSFDEAAMAAEQELRRKVLQLVIEEDICLLQLPCPEYLQYGYHRWGHTYDQFDNAFFRKRCREMLEPIVLQLEEYIKHADEFQILGVLGIDGSPSCGVKYTCRAKWGGEFEGRDVAEVFHSCKLESGRGVFMEVFEEMLKEKGICLKMEGLFAPEPERALRMCKEIISLVLCQHS